MNWFIRLLTVLVGFALLHCHSDGVSMADEFDVRIGKWDAWSKHVWGWPVDTKTKFSDEESANYNHRLLKPVDNHHYCLQLDYQSSGKNRRQVIIRNPSYYAELAIGLDDHWVLVALTHSTDEKFQASMDDGHSMNYFQTDIADPGNFLKKILNERESLNVSATRDGQSDVFELSPKSNTKPEAGTLFDVSNRFVFWFDNHTSPFRIDYSYPGEGNETVNVTRVLDEWQEVGGVQVPARGRIFMPKGYSETEDPLQTATFDYSSINTPLSRDECYLSFYGIPEPGGSEGGGFLIVGLAILGLVVCSAGVYFWRRAS